MTAIHSSHEVRFIFSFFVDIEPDGMAVSKAPEILPEYKVATFAAAVEVIRAVAAKHRSASPQPNPAIRTAHNVRTSTGPYGTQFWAMPFWKIWHALTDTKQHTMKLSQRPACERRVPHLRCFRAALPEY